MKEKALEKLAEWRESHNICEGSYKGNHYKHIMYLSSDGKGERRSAIAEALKKYDVLTDGVKYYEQVLPIKELHTYANHLNSSQILCYNFFGKLLAINESSKRIVEINPEMKKWLDTYLPSVPMLFDDAHCEFEAVINRQEGTSFDFIAYDDNTEIRFEIKFTEYGFGKAEKDRKSKSGISHHQKFIEIYQQKVNNSAVVRNPDNEDDFFRNYQLFRNAISGNRCGKHREIYNVFIYPSWNKKCAKEFKNFMDNYVVDKTRIFSLVWDKIVPQNMTGFKEKYLL